MLITIPQGSKCSNDFHSVKKNSDYLEFTFSLNSNWDRLLNYLTTDRIKLGLSPDVTTHKIFGLTNQNILLDLFRIPDSIRLGIRPHKDVKTQLWSYIPVCYVHQGGVRYYPRMEGELKLFTQYVCQITKKTSGYSITLIEASSKSTVFEYVLPKYVPPVLNSSCRTSPPWIEPLSYVGSGKTGVPFDIVTEISVVA